MMIQISISIRLKFSSLIAYIIVLKIGVRPTTKIVNRHRKMQTLIIEQPISREIKPMVFVAEKCTSLFKTLSPTKMFESLN